MAKRKKGTTLLQKRKCIDFVLEKFHPYLLDVKVTICTNNSSIKHWLSKRDSKPRLIRWMLPLHEFQLEIK